MQFKESKVILIPDKQTEMLYYYKSYNCTKHCKNLTKSPFFSHILVFYVYLFRLKKNLEKRSCWYFDSHIPSKIASSLNFPVKPSEFSETTRKSRSKNIIRQDRTGPVIHLKQ